MSTLFLFQADGWKEKLGKGKTYIAQVFYIPQAVNTWIMHFTVIQGLELLLEVGVITIVTHV